MAATSARRAVPLLFLAMLLAGCSAPADLQGSLDDALKTGSGLIRDAERTVRDTVELTTKTVDQANKTLEEAKKRIETVGQGIKKITEEAKAAASGVMLK